ncbi:CHAT domain-containing protein [Aquimarina litoralis]|uniref:CHAT domain-containing protein n=1 Tax=Aquimarina litoralis TaxID=584605 RepID=UPI001C5623E3|nr:CHAT domain-containing protein [Aquimarina litoralis]MBW1298441.1 CHAT domain-containing protein [Aquimarina litoralis]
MRISKIKYIIFFWLLIGYVLPISGQNCYEQFVKLKEDKKVFEEIEIDNLLDCTSDTAHIIEISHFFSVHFYKKRKYSLAIKYAKIEVDHFTDQLKNSVAYENALYNLGRFYFKNREFTKGVVCFKNVIETNITSIKVARSYGELGKYFRRKGELYIALDYSKKGIYLLEKEPSKNNSLELSLLSLYINTTIICDELNTKTSSDQGVQLLKKADSLILLNPKILSQYNFYSLNATYANLYANKYLNDFSKSKYYYTKNLEKGIEQKDSSLISNSYVNLGELYYNRRNDSALFYLEQSLVYNTDDINKKAGSYRNIANYFNERKNYELALENIKNSLSWSFGLNGKITNQAPSELQLFETTDRRNVFRALRSKITILFGLYEKNQDPKYLKEVIHAVTISDRLVTVIIENSFEINTKLLWRKEASDTYTMGVRAAYLLQDKVAMFRFMEKNKALLLIQGIKENTIQYDLPKGLLDKRLALKESILSLENSVHQNQDIYTKEKDSLFELKKMYQAFNDSLYKVNPKYIDEKLRIEPTLLSDVKEKLDSNTVIVAYALDEQNHEVQNIFGLVITSKNTFSFEVKNTNDLLINLDQYQSLISKPLKKKKELNSFKEVSYSLYQQLFPGEHLKKLIKNKHLVLIPDVSMQNIPFEAFNVSENSLKYLIEQNDISYTYSASFLEHNSRTKRKTNSDFIGFAPIQFSNANLPELGTTEEEILSINTIVKGDTYLLDQASKEMFMKKSEDAKIIHLATHANSGEKPEIYFFKDTIRLHELYTYKNNSDLVVLSACQTNLGKINKGEGVFSLARGFFYSGANTVVSSLWNVNDTSTSSIMKDFYEDLDASSSKVKALSNAKRKYIKEHSLSEVSPYYWASFVLIGDTNQVFENNFTAYYIIGFLILIFFIFIFFRKKG